MLGLNMFALLMFAAINITAVCLSRGPAVTRCRVLRIGCLILLLFNTARYLLSPVFESELKLPVEFSAFSYFAVPLILLCRLQKVESWAVFSGFTAGFFYYAAMIMAGGTIYGNSPPVDVYISMGCHGILYLCGFVKLKTCVYTSNDYPKLLGGTACIVLHAHLLRPLTNPSARLFIYALLDGTYVKAFFSESLLGKILPVYYIGIVCLLLLWIRVFFILNRMEFRKYMKQEASVEALSGS